MSEHFDPYYVWLGIPPEESAGGGPNHYRLLGLRPFEANADVISNAVDQRRTFLRTMQSGKRGPQSQQLLNEVSAAGVCLLNPEKKARYDEELRRKLAPAPAATPPSPPPLATPVADTPRPMSAQPQPAAIVAVKPRRKSKAPSTAALAGLIVSCAAALGIIGAGVAWWLFNGRSASGPIATAPADAGTQVTAPETTATPIEPEKVSPSPGTTAAMPQPAVIDKPAAIEPPPPPASNPPTPPIPPETSATSSSPAPIQPPQPQPAPNPTPLPVGRPQPPSGEALTSAMEQARKIYETDFKTATKSPQKAALARRILETGKATQGDPTARYVLIDLARKLFVQAGEVGEALGAARLLENEYDVPREELVTTTLDALESAQLLPEQRAELAKTCADLADSAAGAEEFERADKLAALALAAARKQRDGDLQKEIAQRRAQIGDLLKDWNAVKASLEKLKGEPNDAEANLAAGKFYCFTVEDFQRGLPYLSVGSDSLLAEAARLDIAAAEGPAKRLEAATAWQHAEAKIKAKDDKQAIQRREKWLLTQAVSSLTGLDQIKAQKRLDELRDLGQGRAGSVAAISPRTPAPRRNVAMMGRLLGGNNDAGIVVTYDHGYSITEDDFARMLAAAEITSPKNLKLGLVGGFVLQENQTVSLHRSGKSGVGGSHRVWVDARPYNIGPNNSYNVTNNIRLNAGLHVVRWELVGDDLGTAQLEIRAEPATSGGSTALLPMAVDRTVEQAAHKLPSKANVHFGSR